MIGPVFVDTNVFVYLHDDTEPDKKRRADDWIALLIRRRSGRLSFQVLQELYVTLTRKAKSNLDARDVVRDLATWQPVAIDLPILERAWLLQERYSLSWWDALIVAAAHSGECSVLLTEDIQHGQRLGSVRVIDPFASPEQAPSEILAALRP